MNRQSNMKLKPLSIILSSIILLALAAKPAAAVTNYVETLNGTFTGNGAGLSNIPPSAVSGVWTNNDTLRRTNLAGITVGTNAGFTVDQSGNQTNSGVVSAASGLFAGSGGVRIGASGASIGSSGSMIYFLSGFVWSQDLSPVGFHPTRGIGGSVPVAYLNSSNITALDTITATNGFASYATNGPVNIAASGWTNTFRVNARVKFDGTAMTYNLVRANGTGLYTNAAVVTHGSEELQPGEWLLISGTGVTGSAFGF